jgi:hypothetical protein
MISILFCRLHVFDRPHLGGGRKIHLGQKIHYSFIEGAKKKNDYTPKARPLDDSSDFWKALCNNALNGSTQLIEKDTFYRAADAVKKLLAKEESEAHELFKEIFSDSTLTSMLPFIWLTSTRCSDRIPVLLRRGDRNPSAMGSKRTEVGAER